MHKYDVYAFKDVSKIYIATVCMDVEHFMCILIPDNVFLEVMSQFFNSTYRIFDARNVFAKKHYQLQTNLKTVLRFVIYV